MCEGMYFVLRIFAGYARVNTQEQELNLQLDSLEKAEKEDLSSYTPLHLAVQKRYLETARLLIEKGADVNGTDNQGRTPLLLATMMEHTEIVKLLAEKTSYIK